MPHTSIIIIITCPTQAYNSLARQPSYHLRRSLYLHVCVSAYLWHSLVLIFALLFLYVYS